MIAKVQGAFDLASTFMFRTAKKALLFMFFTGVVFVLLLASIALAAGNMVQ
jgi:hypothetical protein